MTAPTTWPNGWQPIETAPRDDGWYLVAWRDIGDDSLSVDCSEFAVGCGFSDRWGSNAEAVAWQPLPPPPQTPEAQP